MSRVKARALITLLPSEEGGLAHALSSRTQSLVVCAHRGEKPRVEERPFAAEITADDEEPLAPGDRNHIVTIAFTDNEASEYLHPGDRFRLWRGQDVGRGIVSRRVLV